jgi:hypothetical protein
MLYMEMTLRNANRTRETISFDLVVAGTPFLVREKRGFLKCFV